VNALKEEFTESMENYLKVILELEKANKVARAKDIADRLHIQRGSVTGALKILRKKGLINYQPYSFITLSEEGEKIAKDIAYRHKIIEDFLTSVLHVEPEVAAATACRMEHAIDENTLKRLVSFIDYLNLCPRTGKDWLESFISYCSSGDIDRDKCKTCINDCKDSFKKIDTNSHTGI
jgi:DtxR family transcriptional regulator, Mn-dependent transcriptional regulator